MFSMKPTTVLPLSIALAALSTLAACGGGHASPVAVDPQPPAQPAPPQPAPPVDPAPAPGANELTLEPGYTSISSTTSFSQPNWPAWNHSGTASVDGVGCARSETYHTHALLTVYRNGVRLALPDSIGRGSGCNYEMHTHDGSGVLHIETDVPRTFTLGQFLSLWGQGIGGGAVLGMPGPARYYLISNETIAPVTTDPAAIPLAARTEIVILLGTPPAALPRYDWAGSGL
jgi:hypothetical protein